jgi:ribonuclease HI
MLFTDGSVNPQSKIGYGAYLVLADKHIALDELNKQVIVKRFENTSSTKLELQTLLWALNNIQSADNLTIYTDSQNIIGLPSRREYFEKNDYYSKNHKRLNNYQLYQEFYKIVDQLDYELIKVRGHKVANQKNDIDRIFTLVDRASRNALRSA